MGKSQLSDANAESTEKRSGPGAWVKRHWVLSAAITALVGATTSLMVNEFGPDVIGGLGSGPPLRFVVKKNIYVDGASYALAHDLRKPLPDVPEGCGDLNQLMDTEGAVDVGSTRFEVTIEGLSSSPVLIRDIRAVIDSRAKPIQKAVVTCAAEGVEEVIGLGFNLDEEAPIARLVQHQGGPLEDGHLKGSYFERKKIELSKGESETLDVTALTEQCFCEWRLGVDALVDGEQHTLVIDDNGEPFQTSAWVEDWAHRYTWLGGEWLPPSTGS